jgi:hypothetical protein
MQTQEQTQNAVRRRLADLKTLRDMVRVDINLAGKEARERWRRIEARINTVEKRVRGSAGFQSLEALIQVVQDYRSSFRREPRK